MWRIAPLLAVALCGSVLPHEPTHAQEPAAARADRAGPARRGVGSDLKAYVTAPLRWRGRDWLELGGMLAAVGVAYQRDDDVRDHFVPPSDPGTGDTGTSDLHDAVPAAVALGGTWLYATLIDDDDGRREAATMLEAAVFSSAAAFLIKDAAGRERPNVTTDPGNWGESGDSFPSMHVAAAFAIGAVLAESGNDRYRWLRRVLGYGIGLGTAYERLDHNAHWLSDTVAGAGLGLATARFAMKRREPGAGERAGAISVLPLDGGMMLSYAVPLR
jgi:hypothetical protein